MLTTLLAVVLVLFLLAVVLLLFGVTCYQMATCPFWLCYHLFCGTLGLLAQIAGALVELISELLSGSTS